MKHPARLLWLLLLLFVCGPAQASILAVLEISGAALPGDQRSALTDAIRQAAVDAAMGSSVVVMTQANMEVMLSDMGLDASCISEGACEVDTLRTLQAEYGITGKVVAFGDTLLVTVQLYETKGGTMLKSKQVKSSDPMELLETGLPAATTELMHRIPGLGGVASAPSAPGPASTQAAPSGSTTPMEKTRELESPTLGKLVCISPGTFTMGAPLTEAGRGSNETQRSVELTREYCVMVTEVTQGQWESVMGTNPSYFKKCGADCPVERVSWNAAVAFANALSRQESLEECYSISGKDVIWANGLGCTGYRLPTEAEWEAAARAGEDTAYAGGHYPDAVAWHRGNSSRKTHAVGGKQPNAWGLYDMSGNVLEWCWDWYYDSPPSGYSVDPVGPQSGSARVLRGGTWFYNPPLSRAAGRLGDRPHEGDNTRGLRLVRQSP